MLKANEETYSLCTVPYSDVGFIRNHISAFDLQKQLKGIKKQRGIILPAASVQLAPMAQLLNGKVSTENPKKN